MIDRANFYAHIRADLFGGKLLSTQVKGIDSILDCFHASRGAKDIRQLAYMLATAYHETTATMQPVRETLAKTDAAAIATLDAAFAGGRLKTVKTPYWRPDETGKSWLGRGFVQLTHRRNYEAMSRLTGIDLIAKPDRAMEMGVAATILVEGMHQGSFTGQRLSDFFTPKKTDWRGARTIINGKDRAGLVAGYGVKFLEALAAAISV